MTLDDIHANLTDQDKGRWLEVVDPWDGKPVGLRLLMAGPDSRTQHRARIAMMDELSEVADADGKVNADQREKARLNCLARCVLSWDIAADFGLTAPFSHGAVLKVLQVAWVQAQADAFAADRSQFRPEGR